MAELGWRSRLGFATRRTAEHILHLNPKDSALQERILADMSRRDPEPISEVAELHDPNPEVFFREYGNRGRPVVLRGLAKDWTCVRNWSPSMFAERYGDQLLSVMDNDNTGGAFNVEELSIQKFMDMVESGDTTKYLRFGNLLHRFPELVGDFDHDALSKYMGRWRLGGNMGVFLGAKGTRTTLHAAPPDNLFAQVYGRKKWLLIPSRFDPVLRPVMAHSTYYWSEFDPTAPDYEAYPAARYLPIQQTVLEPGDVLYNPPSYWHRVDNLTATIGVGFRWLSPMAARLNLSQLLLFFLATNPPLWFVARNKKDYTNVLKAAEAKTRSVLGASD